MAHFLSEATHQRLELRDQPDEKWSDDKAYDSGVVKTHVFQSAMRCVSVIGNYHSDDQQGLRRYPSADPVKPSAFSTAMKKSLRTASLDVTKHVDAMPRLQIWTGDTEGTTTARVGLTGAPVHFVAPKREKGTYPYSIHHHEPNVWVGFTDGFIHVFNAHTAAKVCELRAHTAAVNVITSVGTYVFTAGSDWQILQWDPVEIKRVPHGQFSGHQNAVRCLTGAVTEGSAGVLYSGGDDYVVRCWDLDTGYERSDPWPIVGHTGSVRCVALHGVYLFTSSADGQVKAWNTQTAQLVRSLDDRGSHVTIGALAIDAAAPAVWAGGSDGIIRMWDAQSLVLIGERADHHTTNVAMLNTVGRANAVKAWVLDESGALTTVFSDPDGACSITGQGGYAALKPLETELQRQVDTHRVRILQNYAELERCREEFEKLQAASLATKGRFAIASCRTQRNIVGVVAEHQARRFYQKRRVAATDQLKAASISQRAELSLARRFFADWIKLVEDHRDSRVRKHIASQIVLRRSQALCAHYSGVLTDYQQSTRRLRLSTFTAAVVARSSEHAVARSYFRNWLRCSRLRRALRQQVPFAKTMQRQIASTLVTPYWAKLRTTVAIERNASHSLRAVHAVAANLPLKLLRAYWCQWCRLAATRRNAVTVNKSVNSLGRFNDIALTASYFYSWMHWGVRNTRQAIDERLGAEELELTAVHASVADSEGVNERALEESLHNAQQRLAQLLQEERVWDDRLKREELRKKHVVRESMRSTAIDSTEPLAQQFTRAIYLLKARGVNVKDNEEDILFARQSKDLTPEQVFAAGLAEVRKICASAIRPLQMCDPDAPFWYIGPLFSKLTERKILKAASGLAKMVTAYDMMNVKTFGSQWFADAGARRVWRPEARVFEEALENFGTLLEIAVRAFRIRRGEDMNVGGKKPARRVRSSSRSRSRSRSRSGRKPRSKSTPAPAAQ